jgi:hypothetical protein
VSSLGTTFSHPIFSGTIYELIVFTSSLSNDEFLAVENYLQSVYSVNENPELPGSQVAMPFSNSMTYRFKSYDTTGQHSGSAESSYGLVRRTQGIFHGQDGSVPTYNRSHIAQNAVAPWRTLSFNTNFNTGAVADNLKPRYFHSSSNVYTPAFLEQNVGDYSFFPPTTSSLNPVGLPYVRFDGHLGDQMTGSLRGMSQNVTVSTHTSGDLALYYAAYFSSSMFNLGTHFGQLVGTRAGHNINHSMQIDQVQLFTLSSSVGFRLTNNTATPPVYATSSIEEGVHWILATVSSASTPQYRLIVDGVTVSSGSLSSNITQNISTTNIFLNNRPHHTASTQQFKGELYEVCMWSGSYVGTDEFVERVAAWSAAMYAPAAGPVSIPLLFEEFSDRAFYWFDAESVIDAQASPNTITDRIMGLTLNQSWQTGLDISVSAVGEVPAIQFAYENEDPQAYSGLYGEVVDPEGFTDVSSGLRTFIVINLPANNTGLYQWFWEYYTDTFADDFVDWHGDGYLYSSFGSWNVGQFSRLYGPTYVPEPTSRTYVVRRDYANSHASHLFKINGVQHDNIDVSDDFVVTSATAYQSVYLDVIAGNSPTKIVAAFSFPYDAITNEEADEIEQKLLQIMEIE